MLHVGHGSLLSVVFRCSMGVVWNCARVLWAEDGDSWHHCWCDGEVEDGWGRSGNRVQDNHCSHHGRWSRGIGPLSLFAPVVDMDIHSTGRVGPMAWHIRGAGPDLLLDPSSSASGQTMVNSAGDSRRTQIDHYGPLQVCKASHVPRHLHLYDGADDDILGRVGDSVLRVFDFGQLYENPERGADAHREVRRRVP
jgi:hypothetical protein